ncbi:MAG: translation initiation factor IF-2 [Selenomonadaceae bacterium]|nr:translation initiation factor IF-2 [Selenomonadaceae bacterium]
MSKPIKYRIFDMAKEFNQDAQVIIDFLNKRKIKVKNRYSGVESDAYELVKAQFGRRKPVEEPKPEVKAEPKSEVKPQQQAKIQKPKVDAKPQSGKPQQSKPQQQPAKVQQQPKAQQQQAKPQQQPKVEQSPKNQPQQTKPQQQPKVQPQQSKAQQQPKNQPQQSKAQQQSKNQPQQAKPQQQPKVEQPPKTQSQQTKPQQPQQRENRGKQERPQENRTEQRRDRSQENRGDNRNRDNRGKQQQENRSAQTTQDTRTERGDRDSRKNRGERQREDGGGKNNRNRNRTNPANAKEAAKTQAAQSGEKRPPRPARKKNRPAPAPVHKAEIARPTHIKVGESIAVKDLASKMSCTATEVIKKLLFMGYGATINQEIDFDIAALVAAEFGVTAEELPPEVDPTLIPEIEDDPATLKIRPPVVTVMGHVDHGKTSLLDVIRKSSVTSTEAGGITQHIGAYQVICNDRKIVFLDTPGHEAFTAMRARGAQVTDIAILVVAADDGVMPQTIEAINHAKAANVPIIVAINKIDKPGANPSRVKQALLEYGLVAPEYGGKTNMVEVSAKKNIGINDLLEEILFEADVQEFKANPNREARGVIIEAQLDKGRGPVATVLVQNGTLRIGDSIVAGTTYGKVRAMMNERGDNLKKAGPSVPVEVLGLNDVPAAGDILAALDEKLTKSIAEHRIEQRRNALIKSKKVSLDDLFNQIQAGEIKDLNIVIKADVQGSVEALSSALLSLNKNDEVRVNVVHSGVGAVTENDVMLASSSNALIIGFNVRPDTNAQKSAVTENIDIRTYRVIYDAIHDVEDAMSGMLAPKYKEVIQGRVEIRKVMKFSKALVAGSYVLEGKIFNNSKIRILRDNIEVFDGEIDSLRRFKDEVKEVAAGYECGISIVDYRDFREGDIIEAYKMEEIETSIEDVNRAD